MIRSSLKSKIYESIVEGVNDGCHVLNPKDSSTPAGTHQRFSRALWLAAALIGILAILLVYRLRSTGFAWGVFLATFRVDWRWLSASIALLLFSYFGRALRWEVMLRPLCVKPSLWTVTSATVIGFTAITLLGRAGELVRPYLISTKERVPFSSQMAAWLLERILDLLVVLLIFGIALAHMPVIHHLHPALQWVLKTGGYFVAGIGAVCILLLVAFRNFGRAAQARILSAITFLPDKLHARATEMIQAFVQGVECTRDRRFLALLAGYTILEWIVILGGFFCMFRAVEITSHFGLNEVMIFCGFVAFGSVVQIPGIGGGVQVVSVLVLTEIFKIPLEAATGLAILIWLLSWVIIVPFGLAFAFHEGLNWKKISHITEDVESRPAPA